MNEAKICQGCGDESNTRKESTCAECVARLKHEEETHLRVDINGELYLYCRIGRWAPIRIIGPNFWKVTDEEQEVTCDECKQRCKNWCDRCAKVHVSILNEHCATGEHCTTTTASCSAEEVAHDHPRACCTCRGALDQPYRAQVNTDAMPVPQVRNVQTY